MTTLLLPLSALLLIFATGFFAGIVFSVYADERQTKC